MPHSRAHIRLNTTAEASSFVAQINTAGTADKYIAMLDNTICACVVATTQTYVEALKKENAFTKEAQLEAFNLTFNAVMAVLSNDAKDYLTNIYGDLTAYITNKIEAEVNLNKIVSAE